MIVADTSQALVTAAVRQIAGRMHDPEAAKRVARYDAYAGRRIEEVVSPYFTPNQRASVPLSTQRVVRKIIDGRYCVYKEAPIREADEAYLDRLGDLDEDMSYLERMTGLQGSMAMARFYDMDKEALDSRIIPVFEPLFLPGEFEPFGLVYPLHQPGEQDRAKRVWEVWTTVEHYRVSGSGGVMANMTLADGTETMEHGLKDDKGNPLLPVVFAHNGPPVGQEWMRPGADDVVGAQLHFNVYGTILSLGVLWQTLGQPVATGIDDPRTVIQVGADRVIALPSGSTFRFESSGASLPEVREAMRFVVDSVAYANHLVAKWASGGGATSGEHLRLMEVDLTEAITTDFRRWEAVERERFRVDRAVLAGAGINISDDYSVTFSEPHIPLSMAEKQAGWEWLLAQGLTTKRRVLAELNPGMAEAQLDDLLAEIGEAAPAAAETAGPSAFAAALARPVQ